MEPSPLSQTSVSNQESVPCLVIQQAPSRGRAPKSEIGSLAVGAHWVASHEPALSLIQDFETHPEIPAVGVLDGEGRPVGMVVRDDLFAFLATQFGRSISHFRTVQDVMKPTRMFDTRLDIQQVAAQIAPDLAHSRRCYFTLTHQGRYAGLFTNLGLMMCLAARNQQDLRFAAEITRVLVREETFLRGDGWDLLATSRPAQELGGDIYQVFRRGADRLLLFLGDVCGKGVPASLVTCYLSGFLEKTSPTESIDHLAAEVNRKVHLQFGIEKYVTGLFCEIDAASGLTRFIDMGHGHLYLYRRGKVVQLKTTTREMPLGVEPEPAIHAHQLTLEPRDVLIFATDGIADQRNEAGETFGLGDLFYDLSSRKHLTGEVLLRVRDEFLGRLKDFRGTSPQSDDMTLLLYLQGGEIPAS